jgi:hypothetical protein
MKLPFFKQLFPEKNPTNASTSNEGLNKEAPQQDHLAQAPAQAPAPKGPSKISRFIQTAMASALLTVVAPSQSQAEEEVNGQITKSVSLGAAFGFSKRKDLNILGIDQGLWSFTGAFEKVGNRTIPKILELQFLNLWELNNTFFTTLDLKAGQFTPSLVDESYTRRVDNGFSIEPMLGLRFTENFNISVGVGFYDRYSIYEEDPTYNTEALERDYYIPLAAQFKSSLMTVSLEATPIPSVKVDSQLVVHLPKTWDIGMAYIFTDPIKWTQIELDIMPVDPNQVPFKGQFNPEDKHSFEFFISYNHLLEPMLRRAEAEPAGISFRLSASPIDDYNSMPGWNVGLLLGYTPQPPPPPETITQKVPQECSLTEPTKSSDEPTVCDDSSTTAVKPAVEVEKSLGTCANKLDNPINEQAWVTALNKAYKLKPECLHLRNFDPSQLSFLTSAVASDDLNLNDKAKNIIDLEIESISNEQNQVPKETLVGLHTSGVFYSIELLGRGQATDTRLADQSYRRSINKARKLVLIVNNYDQIAQTRNLSNTILALRTLENFDTLYSNKGGATPKGGQFAVWLKTERDNSLAVSQAIHKTIVTDSDCDSKFCTLTMDQIHAYDKKDHDSDEE